MRNVRITLAAADERYIEPFLLYARTGEFAKRVSVRAFSKLDAFLSAMALDRPDFVLGEPAFLAPWLQGDSSRGVPWAVLGLGSGEADSAALGGPVLHAFQPLNRLLTAVLELAGTAQAAGSASQAGAQVIAVHSAAGGVGKTAVALNLAKQLGGRGLRVFYLNLETWDSAASFRGAGSESGLPGLLYELRTARENGEACRSPLSRHAPFQEKLKSLSFPPLERPDELLQMSEADTAGLLDYLATCGACDVIVADTDTEDHDRCRALLRRADRVLWLLADDLLHLRRTAGWMKYREARQPAEFYDLIGRSVFAVNRCGGRLDNVLPRPDLRPLAFLSYIPSWKALSREDVLLGSPIFQRDILALCGQLGLGGSRRPPASAPYAAAAATGGVS
ncbi:MULTISPECIES: hypothetical protein [Saccharibacillus]|uniref:hypothetical protein n=1 Tax=Saccharibacillus TaxID=456492 RepID=UPI00123A563D|nr:hypothetical protein [Saccharibacillus sp. WB 17]MWJ30706.1 hypothetical protein [Saccharibacillus sp. WB 17]